LAQRLPDCAVPSRRGLASTLTLLPFVLVEAGTAAGAVVTRDGGRIVGLAASGAEAAEHAYHSLHSPPAACLTASSRLSPCPTRLSACSRLVGHDDLMTTARTYTHVVADEGELDYADMLT
jgi:hypothetical protein